jgi:putative ABC transport system permease protein
MNFITPGYFAALRSRLIAGRDFSDGDTPTAMKVAIVNQSLAKKFYGTANPIGQTFRRYATPTTLGDPFLIVGLTQDAKYGTLRDESPPTAYFPLSQSSGSSQRVAIEVRTAAPPGALEASVQKAVLSVNKSAAIQFTTLKQQVDDSVTQERLLATLSGFFGALALLLATIGLYGVLAYVQLRRQKEIGIRLALGASRSTILSMLIGDAAALLVSGCAVGLVIAWMLTRFVQTLLFHLTARDLGTFAMSAGALATAAVIASFVPAWRAMRVDPMVALRHE